MVPCERSCSWVGKKTGVLQRISEFGCRNLTILCYFYSVFYPSRRFVGEKIRYVGFFFSLTSETFIDSLTRRATSTRIRILKPHTWYLRQYEFGVVSVWIQAPIHTNTILRFTFANYYLVGMRKQCPWCDFEAFSKVIIAISSTMTRRACTSQEAPVPPVRAGRTPNRLWLTRFKMMTVYTPSSRTSITQELEIQQSRWD